MLAKTNESIETLTEAAWTCLPFITSGQNHLARHSGRGKKTRQTEKVERQHQGMDWPGVRQVPEGSGGQRKREETVKSTVVHDYLMHVYITIILLLWLVEQFHSWPYFACNAKKKKNVEERNTGVHGRD